MGHYADGEAVYEKDIPAYWGYAIVAFIFNPLGGVIALLFSRESQRCYKRGWKHAQTYSDASFSISILSIVTTILLILCVYAFGYFPADTYFNREDVIRGYTTTLATTRMMNTTIAITG